MLTIILITLQTSYKNNSTSFKTFLKEINTVALAIENIKAAKISGTVFELDQKSLDSFVKGIDGLTLSQAQSALSTRALTDAQKEQILVSAGLIKSSKELTLQEVQQMASSMSLSSTKKEEILTTLQGAYAEGKWNEETLEAIAAKGGEAGVIAQSILAKKTENAENVKSVAGVKALTTSLKEQLTERLALLASNPVAWIVGIGAACVGLVTIQKKLSKSLKECSEDLQKYNSDFETSQSEVESLTSELKTCTTRLDELQKLADNGTISIIEQEEYNRLQKTNEELERNLKLEQEKASISAIEGAKTADQTIGKQFQSNYLKETVYDGAGASYEDYAYVTPQKEMEASIAEYNRLQNEINDLNKSFDSGDIKQDEYTKQLNKLTEAQTRARQRASEMSDILVDCEQAYTNLDNVGGTFSTTTKDNFDSVKSANQEYIDFIDTINGVSKSFDNLDESEKKQAVKNKYASDNKEISDWVDTLNENQLDLVASHEFAQAIDDQAKSMDGASLSAKNFANALSEVENAESGISNENHLSFTEYMNNLESSLSSGFDQLDSIYADVLNKENFDWSSILDNTSFTEAFGNMENVTSEYKNVYDDFIETISNSPDDIGKCQQAFNNLATAYVQNSGVLDDLSESTKQATINRLEEWGVSNAEEVVTSALVTKQRELAAEKAVLANTTSDLSNVTSFEISQLRDEGTISNETAQDITAFAMQKRIANLTTISTKKDISQLGSLCVMLQATGVECSKLKELIDLLNSGEIMSNERRQTIINRIQKEMEDTMANMDLKIKLPEIDYSGADKTKSVLDSTKKSADDLYNDLKSQIEAYLDFMEKSLEAGRIDYDTYCHDVKKYLDDLYNSGKLKAADYFDYIERSLAKQKEIYDKVLSAITDRLQEEIDKWQEKIDALNDTNDKLNDNLSNMDSALDAISKVYDAEIDRIQAIIDGLKDANDERNRTLALEKAKYELDKAYNSRVKKLYVEERGYLYDIDYDAVKDAQKTYDDAELDLKTAKLEQQISDLQKFKDMWDNVKNAYQDGVDQMNASALLGSDFQKTILNNNILDIENFKNQYIGIQEQINSNEELIKSFEEKKTYYNKLKDQWSALSGEYEKQQNRMYAAQVMGADWESQVLSGRIDVMTKFGNDYVAIQDAITQAQWNATNERIKAYQAEADAAAAAANAAVQAERNKQALRDTGDTEVGKTTYNPGTSSAGMPTNANGGDGGNRYAAATADQRKNGTIMSNEQKNTIANSYKNNTTKNTGSSTSTASKASSSTTKKNLKKYASGGVVKVDPNDVFFKDTAKQIGEDTIAFVKDGERILTPVQNKWWEEWTDSIPQMFSLLDNIPHDAFTGMNDLVRNLSENNVTKTFSNNQPVTISIGDIHLHDVQNPDQLADAIIKYMPGTMKQKLSKSGR